MITPEPKPANPAKETCVPATALEANGEEPKVGAEIEFTGKGRVTRIEGGHVYLETTHVNGEPVAAEPAGDMTDEDMMRMAAEDDAAMPA